MATKWARVGAMWKTKRGGYSGYLEFGLLGSIKIHMGPDKTDQSRLNIFMVSDNRLLNRLLGNITPAAPRQDTSYQREGTPQEEFDREDLPY